MADSNWLLSIEKKWYNHKTERNEFISKMLGIYPTYKEAAFIRSKVSRKVDGHVQISPTTKEPTTKTVTNHLKFLSGLKKQQSKNRDNNENNKK